jgi:hypothetical protein
MAILTPEEKAQRAQLAYGNFNAQANSALPSMWSGSNLMTSLISNAPTGFGVNNLYSPGGSSGGSRPGGSSSGVDMSQILSALNTSSSPRYSAAQDAITSELSRGPSNSNSGTINRINSRLNDSSYSDAQGMLKDLIAGLSNRGTPTVSGRTAVPGGSTPSEFSAAGASLRDLLTQFSKSAALTDSAALVNRQAQTERQRNMPAIQRAVEGAGTSAGSMQALLSQKFIDDTALSSAALGAEQAKAYGGISASLASSIAQMAAAGDPQAKLDMQKYGIDVGASTAAMQTQAGLAGTFAQLAAGGDPTTKMLMQLAELESTQESRNDTNRTQLLQTLAQLAASGDPQAKLMTQLLGTQMDVAGRENVANINASAQRGGSGNVVTAAAPSYIQSNSTIPMPQLPWNTLSASSTPIGGKQESRW